MKSLFLFTGSIDSKVVGTKLLLELGAYGFNWVLVCSPCCLDSWILPAEGLAQAEEVLPSKHLSSWDLLKPGARPGRRPQATSYYLTKWPLAITSMGPHLFSDQGKLA